VLRTFRDVRADAKAMAEVLRGELERRGVPLGHGECLELVSRQLGAESWNHLAARRALPWQAQNPTIPVLRVFAVEPALQFYVEFLGFTLDFGGPAGGPGTRWYGQVGRCATTLQLSEHPYDASPGATILIWMSGLDGFRDELDARRHAVPVWGPAVWTPEIEHAPWDARVLTVADPFGNHLRFTEPDADEDRHAVPRWA
jgi:Glyoxalase superfamily protein